jgi:putative glycosyltransferase
MRLSIVTTMYRSAPYLKEFYERASMAARALTDDFEIIFVNDGSPDDSLGLAVALFEQDARVRVIDLSRNFGHHKAIMTGLAHARGDLVFLIDSDLEEAPESLARFYAELKEHRADVIYGVQQKRKGNTFERVSGKLFYKAFNALSTDPLPPNVITVRLMSCRYVAALLQHREREVNIAGLWVITGFKQIPLVIQKKSRPESTYSLRRKLAVLVSAVTSFSNKPLIFIFYLGCVIVALSGVAAAYLVVRRIIFGVLLEGWPSLIVSIWLLGGITIFCVGLIGIYLSKMFMEVKQRPYTIIREIYEREAFSLTIGERVSAGEEFQEVGHKIHEL